MMMNNTITIKWGDKEYTCEMHDGSYCNNARDSMYYGNLNEIDMILEWDSALDLWKSRLQSINSQPNNLSEVFDYAYGNSAQEVVDIIRENLQEQIRYLQNLVNPK
jgi:hypothetical protein